MKRWPCHKSLLFLCAHPVAPGSCACLAAAVRSRQAAEELVRREAAGGAQSCTRVCSFSKAVHGPGLFYGAVRRRSVWSGLGREQKEASPWSGRTKVSPVGGTDPVSTQEEARGGPLCLIAGLIYFFNVSFKNNMQCLFPSSSQSKCHPLSGCSDHPQVGRCPFSPLLSVGASCPSPSQETTSKHAGLEAQAASLLTCLSSPLPPRR